ncbi:KinB-signaling pathway activation protein [Paenibacillus sp. JDR-2]|uniref:KinB-signaling pathway activation protein n=1 Tax=Paenibacillus sp. (strain JDR-2) TaxID=324057 RepID=UPI0001665D43|nr:KinB-signaling pathway activation protein [Paenibacillus sp. JDR-2]ACT04250.1 KinB signaling pathway activation protein [Paenibacillus sp. JDR-2]
MAVGAVVTVISGSIMQWTDQSFGFMGLEAAGFNAFMMAMVGLLIGAFSQMGFFAYLTLNYIALSIFRKSYLWNALQGYTTIFAVFGLGYMLYEQRTNNWFFWVLPLVLLICSLAVAYVKVSQTKPSAFVPTTFLMFFVTFVEAWPALQGETNISAIVFMIIPLFVCNAYQILMLHRLLHKNTTTDSATSAKPVA